MPIKTSDYIAEFLRTQGINVVFEVAGGMITHLLDSCYQLGNMNIISMHHEQATAFAADAYGRCTGKPGVAFATSGPGATNLLTGIGNCYFDSSPALFITGQVNIHEQKGDRKIRQLGFQETDITSMATAVTKKTFKVTNENEVEPILNEAYLTAISDRPGPVLIDLPMNIQNSRINVAPIKTIERRSINFSSPNKNIDHLYDMIKQSKRPLILAGRGIRSAFATDEFLQFVRLTKIPVVTSLLAVDVISHDDPFRVGFIGTYGNRWANLTIGAADLLIVMGSRLDIRQTGADVESFKQNKTIFHIDCDEAEINNRVKNCYPIVSDVKDFLKAALTRASQISFPTHPEWLTYINELKRTWPDTNELKDFNGINPNEFIQTLSNCSDENRAYLVDVGNHQMWAAQSVKIKPHQLFMTSGGMGAMGFSLPAAIGACLTLNKKPVMVIVGDGAFQFNIQELQTIIRNQLPIKIVVINNQSLGMIRQFQDNYFDGRYQSTYWGYSSPDFVAIAKAYGIPALSIDKPDQISVGSSWLWETQGAALLQVMVNEKMNAYPKIAFGKPITEMEPFSKPLEMEGT